ncbi:PIN domain-containing protein [Gramella sp. AN32]|uniref:PIN domain-containing protein n=1 Tax=Christiangramia antarctica TaxID=2058158 RepID=A0ABW5X5H6_9FLAO|nr:PIN domain-containing protein [Gramella sp. AN32]
MSKKKDDKLDALIFIDTNIFLDFYRIRKSDISMKYLEEIEKHKDLIITSNQVEMEFKKNRQSVILDSISEVKKIKNNGLQIPAIISNAQAAEMIKKSQKNIDQQQKKLKQQIERILKNPKSNDPVYKSLQKLFKNESPYNLNRENKVRFKIRNLAKKRFLLGYPPRKKSDNSIGDSVNWEWIISCAEKSGKHIILVTRDTDFGSSYEGESYLNDWLDQEFKQRISRKRKLILTERLMTAFKLVQIPVSDEMIEEEEKILKYNFSESNERIQEALRLFAEKLNLSEWNNNMVKTKDLLDNYRKSLE